MSVANAHRDFTFQEPFSSKGDSFPQLEQGWWMLLPESRFQSFPHLGCALLFLLRISSGAVILALAMGKNWLTWGQSVRLCYWWIIKSPCLTFSGPPCKDVIIEEAEGMIACYVAHKTRDSLCLYEGRGLWRRVGVIGAKAITAWLLTGGVPSLVQLVVVD